MLRSAATKVMWVGRATVFLVGLAVILALVLGVATSALGATGGTFLLGKPNTADEQTSLVGTVANAAQSALVVVNKGTGSALDLRVTDTTKPPMKVNSSAKVSKLNADQLDGKDSTALGVTVLQNTEQTSSCSAAPETQGECAPVDVTVPAGKSYNVTVVTSFTISTANTGNARYCSAIMVNSVTPSAGCLRDGGESFGGTFDLIDLAGGYDESATHTGQVFQLQPGNYTFFLGLVTSQAVTESQLNKARTLVMITDASSPGPPIQ